MVWNLFEKIINAVKSSTNSEQPESCEQSESSEQTESSEQSESVCAEVSSDSQSWNQGDEGQQDYSQQEPDDSQDGSW